ncbi:hypothetical protein PLICRDRAFT_53320 [Plicaturopsis crispa FD-325 SS-3]|nr:hypothetical protein PLICRDRAFT_53320 [Plicaturopsis crispa FD-325 SS-3]
MPRYLWQSLLGRGTVETIVKKCIPAWSHGLRDYQLDLVTRAMDGESILAIVPTGGGKSAVYGVPLVVWLEINKNPHLYHPELPRFEKPVGLVISPTKGLSANIVYELAALGVDALAYTSDTVTEARKTGRKLATEIAEGKYAIICVDPEHLTSKDWGPITDDPVFRRNVVFLCVDEAHLINEWGAEFRPPFRHIGPFARGRFRPGLGILALTGTLEPGAPEKSICASLGFISGNYFSLRLSNERPNIMFIRETLTHGLGGDEFPDLLRYLLSNRKTIIYCATIELCFRVLIYLMRMLRPGPERLRRVRLYHALNWDKFNEETVRLFRDDPLCLVIIATIAFGQGINIRTALDSIQFAVDTIDQTEQQKGRVGRDLVTASRGIVLVQKSAIKAAEKQLNLPSSFPSTRKAPANPKPPKKPKATPKPMDDGKARLLSERGCLVAFMNSHYANAPLELSTLDCIAARRPLPCNHCAPGRSLDPTVFPPSPIPIDMPPPSPFIPVAPSLPQETQSKLSRKERQLASTVLSKFGAEVRLAELHTDLHDYRPRSMYFPVALMDTILDNFLDISSIQALAALSSDWDFRARHEAALFDAIQPVQRDIRAQREVKRVQRNKKAQATRAANTAKRAAALSLPTTDVDDLVPAAADPLLEVPLPASSAPAPPVLPLPPASDGDYSLPASASSSTSLTSVQRKRPRAFTDVSSGVQPNKRHAADKNLSTSTDEHSPAYRTRSKANHRPAGGKENVERRSRPQRARKPA